MMATLKVVLVQRVTGYWLVGIGAVTSMPHEFDGERYRSIRAAKRAAQALAERSGLLIVHSDLPRASRGNGEDLD
jgi:hypothetical protein